MCHYSHSWVMVMTARRGRHGARRDLRWQNYLYALYTCKWCSECKASFLTPTSPAIPCPPCLCRSCGVPLLLVQSCTVLIRDLTACVPGEGVLRGRTNKNGGTWHRTPGSSNMIPREQAELLEHARFNVCRKCFYGGAIPALAFGSKLEPCEGQP